VLLLGALGAIDVADYWPVLDKHFPLENLGDAFKQRAPHTHFGKIVVDV
jgi:NADPH:quinone reductase-like Zn-dependent oxidoreductase